MADRIPPWSASDRAIVEAFIRGTGRMPLVSELELLLRFGDDAQAGLPGEPLEAQAVARQAWNSVLAGTLDVTVKDGVPKFVRRRPAKVHS